MTTIPRSRWGYLLAAALLASGCAMVERPPPTAEAAPSPFRITPNGTFIYAEEFEFRPPPPEWRVLRIQGAGEALGEGEFSFGFIRMEPGPQPSQSVFVYDEAPFGYSLDLETRAKQHLKRFLWGAVLQFRTIDQQKVKVLGGDGLAVTVEGRELVKKQKVRAKLVFGKRGEQVVSFYINQWRPMDAEYDLSAFSVFDAFVDSFRYVKKSFFETL